MFDPSELPSFLVAVCLGVLLGGLYFGGLWWTVGRMPQARHPLNLYFGSLIVRQVLLLAAFFGLLSYSGWPQLVAVLVGFAATRLLLVRLIGQASGGELPQREAI